jgi:serine/threonine protein kinase
MSVNGTTHPKINPNDLNAQGLLLSEKTIAKNQAYYKFKKSPSFLKLDKSDPLIAGLCAKGETPRSILFFDGIMYITYRNLSVSKEDGCLQDSKTRAVRLAQVAHTGEWVVLRSTIKTQKSQKNEIAALEKLGRLIAVKEVINKKGVKKRYIVEKLIMGTKVEYYLNSQLYLALQHKISTCYVLLICLQELHEQGIYHGDCYGLENFILDPNNYKVVPIDFECSMVSKKKPFSQELLQNIANENKLILSIIQDFFSTPVATQNSDVNNLSDPANDIWLKVLLQIHLLQQQEQISSLTPFIKILSNAILGQVNISASEMAQIEPMIKFIRWQRDLPFDQFSDRLKQAYYDKKKNVCFTGTNRKDKQEDREAFAEHVEELNTNINKRAEELYSDTSEETLEELEELMENRQMTFCYPKFVRETMSVTDTQDIVETLGAVTAYEQCCEDLEYARKLPQRI